MNNRSVQHDSAVGIQKYNDYVVAKPDKDQMEERIDYRFRKKVFQQSQLLNRSDQLDRLDEHEWDILIVLDACRQDTLEEVAGWPVGSTISPGSCTPNWLTSVANHEALDDTHAVSGNPQYEKADDDLGFKKVEPLWESHWNDALQTTLPEPILDRVDEVVEQSSTSVVAHLQQPHWPYVAKLGETWALAYNNLGPWYKEGEKITSVQVAMQRGLIDAKSARKAYKASVMSVWNVLIEYLGRWIAQDCNVIVTADHGETFGRLREIGLYEHPCGCRLPPLVRVPWMEFRGGKSNRRKVTDIDDRLRALGYAD